MGASNKLTGPMGLLAALTAGAVGGLAHAAPSGGTAASSPLLETRLADHQGSWTADGIAWKSRVLLAGQPQEGDEVHFAWPVEGEPTSPDVEAWLRNAAGEVVGARLHHGDAWLSLEVDQPSNHGAPPGALVPPALEGDGIQRVIIDGLVYRPHAGLDLDARLKTTVHASISKAERRSTDRALEGRRSRPREHPIYFVVDEPLRKAEGLAGELEERGVVGHEVLLASSGAFGLVVLGLLGAGRLLGQRVKEDDIHAYLEREFLTPPPEGPDDQPKVARK